MNLLAGRVLGRGSLQVNPLIFSEQQQISSKGGSFSEVFSDWCIRRSVALWYVKYLFLAAGTETLLVTVAMKNLLPAAA